MDSQNSIQLNNQQLLQQELYANMLNEQLNQRLDQIHNNILENLINRVGSVPNNNQPQSSSMTVNMNVPNQSNCQETDYSQLVDFCIDRNSTIKETVDLGTIETEIIESENTKPIIISEIEDNVNPITMLPAIEENTKPTIIPEIEENVNPITMLPAIEENTKPIIIPEIEENVNPITMLPEIEENVNPGTMLAGTIELMWCRP